MLSQEATKRFVAFQGFALCVRVCREISRERALGYSPPPPSAPAWWQAEKPQIQKVRLTPVQKEITLFSIGRCQTDGITQSAVFLPPTAAFFYGHRPLFEPCRLLSSCKAWRWGWRRRQGGKRVFRLASPTATKRRSRQHPPWLFVFISTYYISR